MPGTPLEDDAYPTPLLSRSRNAMGLWRVGALAVFFIAAAAAVSVFGDRIPGVIDQFVERVVLSRVNGFLGNEACHVFREFAAHLAAKIANRVNEEPFAIGECERQGVEHRRANGVAAEPMAVARAPGVEVDVAR